MKNTMLFFATLTFLWISFINGCRKDPGYVYIDPNKPPVITTSFTEDFESANIFGYNSGWRMINNSSPNANTGWHYGYETDKDTIGPKLAPAFSFTTDAYQFMYAGHKKDRNGAIMNIDMWMFSPPVQIKNGDRISFYTKCDTVVNSVNKLEVRLNPIDTGSNVGSSFNSIGNYTEVIGSVNNVGLPDAYPRSWTRIDITVTGLATPKTSRIAFRYYVPAATTWGAIGVDLLKFEKQ